MKSAADGGPSAGTRERVHGRTEVEWPQLELVRPDLERLPALAPPSGYALRSYQAGDEAAWGEIMSQAFNPDWDREKFRRLMAPHFGFSPERVFFACHQGRPVGSASAFGWPGLPPGRGYIHMVGALPEHCGRGLGYWLTVACLRRLREDGFGSAMLQTESFRLPAIKHYLRLGFRPVPILETQRELWRTVLGRVGLAELGAEFGLDQVPVMDRFSFWRRAFVVSNYTGWLNFKAELRSWTRRGS